MRVVVPVFQIGICPIGLFFVQNSEGTVGLWRGVVAQGIKDLGVTERVGIGRALVNNLQCIEET